MRGNQPLMFLSLLLSSFPSLKYIYIIKHFFKRDALNEDPSSIEKIQSETKFTLIEIRTIYRGTTVGEQQ